MRASKNVQIITGSTIKTFQLKNSINPLVNLNVLFFLFINLTLLAKNIFFQYFFLVSLKYLKTYGNGLNLSIIHFWLITHVFQLCLYMHMLLPLKVGVCCIYAYSLFVWDSRDIRGLYFSNFSLEKYILVKM